MPILRGREPYNQVLNMGSFWLMTSGMAFMTFTLTFAGVIQTHLQRVMGMTYMEVQDQIGLFYIMRFGAGVAVVLGALLFIYSQLGGAPRDHRARARGRAGRVTVYDARPVPFYRPVGDECAVFEAAHAQPAAAAAEGADRLRQDAVRRAHGGAARAAALHRRLP